MLKKFLSPFVRQAITSREDQATFRLLQATVFASLFGAIGTLIAIDVFGATPQARWVISLLTGFLFVSLLLLQRRILWPARVMAPLSLFATVTFLLVTGSGIHDIAILGYGGVIIVSSLTLGRRGALISSVFIVIAVFSISSAEINKTLITDASQLTTADDPYLISIVVLSIAVIQTALITRMNTSLQEARDYAKAQTEANREVIELKNSLEERVQLRTEELARANHLNARRASLFEAIALVARSVTTLDNPSALLPNLAQQISRLFGFEYVAIYATSDNRREQTNVAVFDQNIDNSPSLLTQSNLGTDTLAGIVFVNGLSRTAFNEGADSVYFSAPAITAFNSEIALPLIAAARVIGVLDVMSKNRRAFDSEEVSTLAILADVISNAIESSKQFQISRNSLNESVTAYAENLGQEWGRFKQDERLTGFRYFAGTSEPLSAFRGGLAMEDLPESTRVDTITDEKGRHVRMLVPVRLRGETLGTLEINMREGYIWSEDDIDIVEIVAERLALSMENARLFQTSASRAEREKIVSEISSKISGSVRVDSILRTTAQELSQALSGAEVLIQLQAGNPQGGPQ